MTEEKNRNSEDSDVDRNKKNLKEHLNDNATDEQSIKPTQDEILNVNRLDKEITCNEETKDIQVKAESQVENSTETLNSINSPLEEIALQSINDIDAQTKDIYVRKNEIKNKNERYLKNSNLSVNLENSYGISKTNLIADEKPITRFEPKWKQLMAAMGPYLMIFSAGLSTGFSATLLPQLKQEQSVILVNSQSPSWIASLAALPMAPGCFIGGWIMEKLGRRKAICILSIPFSVGWILIASAPNLTLMLTGRFLNGLSIGLLAPPMSVLISETCSPKLRGMFLAFLSFSLSVGILVAHIIGTWMSWRWTAIICSVCPLFSAGLLIFIPESPVWLFTKGKSEEAIKSFYWLRGHDDEVQTELKAMIDKFKSVETLSCEPWNEKLKSFYSPEFWKPLFIMVTVYLTCQFSGLHAITFYSVDIIEKAVGTGIDSYLAMLIIDTLRVVICLITCLISRKCPRRTLCITSGSLTTLSLAGLSMFLYFYSGNIPSHLSAIPLCFLAAYIIAMNIGLMPLPWIIVGEIFPAKVRSTGAGLASAIGYASIFIVIKTAPTMMLDLGQVITFMCYGTVSFIGTIILYFILPETKGKSLLEIEAMFRNSKIGNSP